MVKIVLLFTQVIDIKTQTLVLSTTITDGSRVTWQTIVGEQLGQVLYIAKSRRTDLNTLPPTSILSMLGIAFIRDILSNYFSRMVLTINSYRDFKIFRKKQYLLTLS